MRIVVGLPQTGFQRPADKELLALLKIVSAAHPREARETAAPEFARAFHAVGFFFRTAAPRRDRHFVHSILWSGTTAPGLIPRGPCPGEIQAWLIARQELAGCPRWIPFPTTEGVS